MPNRIELDVQGTMTTLPLNPIGYDAFDVEEHQNIPTFETSIRFTPFSDSRQRTMIWKGLPNKTPYYDIPDLLIGSVGISGVRINHRDLNVAGDLDYWKPIRVDDVKVKYHSGAGRANSLNYLSYDLEFYFTYMT